MGSDERPLPPESPRVDSDLALPEGLEAGLVAGLAVALVYLVHDLATGTWLHTPSVLGSLLLFGPDAAREVDETVAVAAVYNVVHFAGWIVLGFAGASLSRRAERTSRSPAVLLAVALLILFLLSAGLDLWGQRAGLPRTHLWLGSFVGCATLLAYHTWRHPRAGR